ncbi:MAG: Lrp/AsnC family transcriptional regulator, partial [Candidatus Micrarchaeota archaeon]
MEYSFKEKIILRKLSEDATASIEELASAAKCSRTTAYKILSALEEKYKIKYTVELDGDKLGIIEKHLLIVKFKEKPSEEFLRGLFASDNYISDAYLCEGDFDLIIYATSNEPMHYIVWESRLPARLAEFEAKVYPSEVMLTHFGYFPLNPEQISMAKLNEKDKLILAELLRNSRQSITSIAKKLNIGRTTLAYRIYMLKKRGVIKRFTISVGKPHKPYILVFLANYTFTKDTPMRSIRMMNYYKSYDEQLPLLNTFQLLVPLSGSYRFFAVGLFEDEKDAMKHAIKAHQQIF